MSHHRFFGAFLKSHLCILAPAFDIGIDGMEFGATLQHGILECKLESPSPYLEDHPMTGKWLITMVSKSLK